jgi:hypothetical protein
MSRKARKKRNVWFYYGYTGALLENLANRYYAVQAFDLTGVDGPVRGYPGAPR